MTDKELEYISYATDKIYHGLYCRRRVLGYEAFITLMDEMMEQMGYVRVDGKYRRTMTLEEAKKEIEMRADAYYRGFKGWDKEHPEWHGKLEKMSESDGLDEALSILEKVDVGKPDKLTLTELAHELRKIFRFKYLTASEDWPLPTIIMWGGKVEYDGRGWNMIKPKSYYGSFNVSSLCTKLDLSEYADADGNIDYSKCIVEVEE